MQVDKGIHPWRWRALAVWIIAFSLFVGFQIHQNRIQGRKGSVSLRALCAFKQDLSGRIESYEDFIKAHPNGIPGISIGTLKTSLFNQRATLSSLRVLGPYCENGKVVNP